MILTGFYYQLALPHFYIAVFASLSFGCLRRYCTLNQMLTTLGNQDK